MDMGRISDGIVGTMALVFGLHAIVTQRVTLADDVADDQIWLYGWRAVAIGLLFIAISIFCFACAFGFIHWDGA